MKKIVCAVLCAMMMIMVLCPTALADPKHVSLEGLEAKVIEANATIDSLVEYAKATEENDVKWLLHQIDKIVHDVKSYAKKLRIYAVECQIVYHEIDGQTVAIDPLRVIKITD